MATPEMHEPCPCDSGLRYEQCCGVVNRTAGNADIVARLTNNGSIETNGQLTAQMDTALNTFETTPDLFPARIDFFERKTWFVKMSPQWYSESVFLDPGRIRGSCVIEVELERLQQMTQGIAWQPSAYIFHSAFCGSTLMAQALDAIFSCLPLREPEVLGNLQTFISPQTKNTEQQKNDWLDRILRLLSRRYISNQKTVIKTNDFANPMMIKLLDCPRDIPILFMYTPLPEFVAACLKVDSRRKWIRSRYKTVSANTPRLLTLPHKLAIDDESYAQMAAIYWSYNIALYLEAWQRFPDKLHSLDINTLLAQPRESIEACGHKFGLKSLDGVDTKKQINGLFGIYSKNSKLSYSPQQRTEDIGRLLTKYKTEMDTADQLARQLLTVNYPDDLLAGPMF